MYTLWQCTSDEMKLLKPVNLITAGPEDVVAAPTSLVGRTSEVSVDGRRMEATSGFYSLVISCNR